MKPKNFTGYFTITAHTGCEKTPQNSLESVDKALKSGAEIFEVDVRFDKNGTPVICHDAPKGGEPLLEDVFKKIKENENILCNLDLKVTDNLKEIVVLAKKYDILDRIFYTGVFEKFVESVKNDTPEIPYYLNLSVLPRRKHTEEYLNSLVDKVKASGAIGINCNYRNVTPELFRLFRENGLLISVWTVDRKSKMAKFSMMKPDNITTRKPSLLRKVYNKKVK